MAMLQPSYCLREYAFLPNEFAYKIAELVTANPITLNVVHG